MSPLVSMASGASARGFGLFGSGAAASSFESIATATGDGSSGTITFSSIPQTYAALQIRFNAKDTDTGTAAQSLVLKVNGSSSNYATHRLYGDGSTADAIGSAPTANNLFGSMIPSSGGTLANIMATGIIDIHNYASTSQNKTLRYFMGADANLAATTWRVYLGSGLWADTTAINSISITTNGTAFSTSTTIALYGIKGA